MPPELVIRPILPFSSVNQSAPSGPAVMDVGLMQQVAGKYCVITPVVVMRPMLWEKVTANHRAPSDPAVIPNCAPQQAPDDNVYSVKAPFRSEERRVGKECRSRWSP